MLNGKPYGKAISECRLQLAKEQASGNRTEKIVPITEPVMQILICPISMKCSETSSS